MMSVTISSNGICGAFSSSSAHNAATTPLKISIKKGAAQSLSFNRTIGKKDHIRIRYMSSELDCDIAKFYLNISVPVFTDSAVRIAGTDFLSDHRWLLFSLRGPPGSYSLS